MSKLLGWDPVYSVHIQRFDAQHKRLFDLINALNEGMETDQSHRELANALNDLVEYVSTHFADEESAMQKFGYTALAEHHAEHVQLARHVVEFKKRFDARKAFISSELMGFLQAWFKQHILRSDKAYAMYLTAQGVR